MADKSNNDGTSISTKNNNKRKQHQKSLGSLLRFFEGMELQVETKSGRIFTGTLGDADASMNLTLEDAHAVVHQQRRPNHPKTPKVQDDPIQQLPELPPQRLSLLSIRGSTIRYIHFPDHSDLVVLIKQGIDREQSASQKYKRVRRR